MKTSFTLLSSLAVVLLLSLAACNTDKQLEWALKQAGDNRAELEKFIEHYAQHPADSLKLKAAKFLVCNMPAHYTLEVEGLDQFYQFADSMFMHENDLLRYGDLYLQHRQRYARGVTAVLPDVSTMSANCLIANLDDAFKKWNTNWTEHLSFEQFCDYMLPYRIADERVENWREIFEARFGQLFTGEDRCSMSVEDACTRLNEELKQMGCKIHTHPVYVQGIRPSTMVNIRFGTCNDYCNLGVYAMRSVGIPVGVDGIPGGHVWNVLLTPAGSRDFAAADLGLGEHVKRWKRIPKVHRRTFSVNPKSLVFECGDEKIPPVFTNPCYADVTSEYFKGVNITVNAVVKPAEGQKYMYLMESPDGGRTTRYLDWAKMKEGKATFYTLGDSLVYFPVYYGMNPAGYPMLPKQGGAVVETLEPNTKDRQTMLLYRKHPVNEPLRLFSERVVGGRFEGANKSDFSDAELLHLVSEVPEMRLNSVLLSGKPYRYIRYLAPKGSHCSMAEIECYPKGSNTPLTGRVLGTEGAYHMSPTCTRDRVFDGDVLTYFDAAKPDGAWVGLDFGAAQPLAEIKYIARNDDNGVRRGEMYELFYRDITGWQSMGKQLASADSLIYHNVPSNALYVLKNHSKGKEERIFTYEQGRQVWW